MRILLWHVHGSWTTSFVQGRHDYLLPVDDARSADGLGRARTWDWPASAHEVRLGPALRDAVDVVVLQRPHEAGMLEQSTGLRAGIDVPAVYVEHNTPRGDVAEMRHPMAGQSRIPVVHVTGFNDLFWDCGDAATYVVEHGVVDPGPRWVGDLRRSAVVVNDSVRRGRVVGTDLLPRLAAAAPVDVFGMRVDALPGHLGLPEDVLAVHEDLPQAKMHDQLARRAVYVHLARWTSLGLSLIEAMHLGMPVAALATTDAVEAVPQEAGVVCTGMDDLVAGVRELLSDPAQAAACGRNARSAALERYGLGRFLDDWDRLLEKVV